jgi:hypothetical protein
MTSRGFKPSTQTVAGNFPLSLRSTAFGFPAAATHLEHELASTGDLDLFAADECDENVTDEAAVLLRWVHDVPGGMNLYFLQELARIRHRPNH